MDLLLPGAFVLVVGMIGILLLVVFIMIAASRRGAANRQDESEMRMMGFVEADDDEQEALSRKLNRLYETGLPGETTGSGKLYMRLEHDHAIYVLRAAGGGNSAPQSIVLVSPEMTLPSFTLVPNLRQDGLLADLANQLLESTFSRVFNRIPVSEPRHFHDVYDLYGDHADRVLSFLTPSRLGRLSGITPGYVMAGEDLFLYMPFLSTGQDPAGASSALRTYVDAAESLFRIFMDDRF